MAPHQALTALQYLRPVLSGLRTSLWCREDITSLMPAGAYKFIQGYYPGRYFRSDQLSIWDSVKRRPDDIISTMKFIFVNGRWACGSAENGWEG